MHSYDPLRLSMTDAITQFERPGDLGDWTRSVDYDDSDPRECGLAEDVRIRVFLWGRAARQRAWASRVLCCVVGCGCLVVSFVTSQSSSASRSLVRQSSGDRRGRLRDGVLDEVPADFAKLGGPRFVVDREGFLEDGRDVLGAPAGGALA